MATKTTLKDLMKPRIIVCGKCGGDLHIIPIKDGDTIKTINICSKCTFKS